MTRDNVLFVLIGILVGFIAGYLMQDVMVSRQPARLMHGQAGQAAPAAGGAQGMANAQPQDPASQARVEQIRELQARVQQNPNDTEALLQLANLAYDSQVWELCVASYERYLDLADADPDALSDLGVCYRETGEMEQALGAFERAQEVAPDHWQSRYNEVVILAFDMGRFDQAEQVLDELRELQPDNPNIETLADEVERRRSS